ncbi:MAG: molecular chaperone TorD family protein, partial [Raoultibacter sp.]
APWSSVYLDLGSLFGPTTLAVERTFKRCGMQNPEGNREPCDHFAYELEFLAEMHKRTASALREGNAKDAGKSLEEAMSFKETYMDPWSNTFLDTVIAGARCDAYCGTALLARGFLEIEGAFLNCETLDRGGA